MHSSASLRSHGRSLRREGGGKRKEEEHKRAFLFEHWVPPSRRGRGRLSRTGGEELGGGEGRGSVFLPSPSITPSLFPLPTPPPSARYKIRHYRPRRIAHAEGKLIPVVENQPPLPFYPLFPLSFSLSPRGSSEIRGNKKRVLLRICQISVPARGSRPFATKHLSDLICADH